MRDVDPDMLLGLCAQLRIVNQDTGERSAFIPNAEQRAVAHLVTAYLQSIVLKSRQVGISTILLAHDLAFAIVNPGVPITLALDTDDNAKKLLGVIRGWCETDLAMRLRVATEHFLVLPNGSRIQAVTSGSRAANGQSRTGRSGSAGLIHVSELAFWTNDQKTFQSLTSTALKNARVVVESTATPAANLFRRLWDTAISAAAADERAPFEPLFLPLEMHEAYRAPADEISDVRWAELQKSEGFTLRECAAWFDVQLRGRFSGDLHGLRQEYPNRAEHAFSHAVGRWIFGFRPMTPLRRVGHWRLYREIADIDEPLAMGVDVGKGVGRDASVIVIMGFWTREIVATWYDNMTPIPSFIPVVKEAMTTWKPKATAVESNGIGAAVYQEAATWGIAGLVEQTSSDKNGEKHIRMHHMKWSIEKLETGVGPELRAEIEGAVDVPGSTITEDGDYVGRDDGLNAASFALKLIEAAPSARPAKPVDPDKYYVPTYRERARRRASGI